MLRSREKQFFLGSYAYLGKLSSAKYSEQFCVIVEYVAKKDRWAVRLWQEEFEGEKILVRAENIVFHSYAVLCEDLKPLLSHLSVAPTDDGNALFCDSHWGAGHIVMEEDPLMVVANSGGDDDSFGSQWHLHSTLESDRGPDCAILEAFQDMSICSDAFVKQHISESTSILANLKRPDDIKDSRRIAEVLSRWQTNSHDFATTDTDLTSLFRWTAKMQHSCEPNCVLQVDSESGVCITRTLRSISAGEQLTQDYTNDNPAFHALGVKDRRAQLSCRGFVCSCVRCIRESG